MNKRQDQPEGYTFLLEYVIIYRKYIFAVKLGGHLFQLLRDGVHPYNHGAVVVIIWYLDSQFPMQSVPIKH